MAEIYYLNRPAKVQTNKNDNETYYKVGMKVEVINRTQENVYYRELNSGLIRESSKLNFEEYFDRLISDSNDKDYDDKDYDDKDYDDKDYDDDDYGDEAEVDQFSLI